jgi:hypothetical protein
MNMSGHDHLNMEHYAYEQAAEYNHYLCMNIIYWLYFLEKNISHVFFSKTKLDIWHLTRGSSTT